MSHWWTSVMLGEQWMAWRPSTSIQRPGTIPNQLRTQAPNYGYSLQHSAVDRCFGNAAYNHSPSLWWSHAICAWSLKMMPSSYSRTQKNMAGSDEVGSSDPGTIQNQLRTQTPNYGYKSLWRLPFPKISILYLKETFLVITNEPQMNQCQARRALEGLTAIQKPL